MKIKRIVICLFSVILVGAGIFRYITLNQKYPPPEIISYSESEPVVYDGQFEITVTDNYFLDEQIVNKVFEDQTDQGKEVKYYILELNVKNTGDTEKEILIYSFILESGAWCYAVNMGAFIELNSDVANASLHPTLAAWRGIPRKAAFLYGFTAI